MLLSQTLNTFWVGLYSLEGNVFFFLLLQEKPVKWFKEKIHFLKAKDMTFGEESWVWTELRGKSWVWKKLQELGGHLRTNKVKFRKGKFRNTKMISSTEDFL